MIQVLIVDDEVHCAEGVKSAIDWKMIQVTGVFTAYSMKQAQAVMEAERIDIIISDVEMPKGSGFELLRWVRDSQYEPVVVMLTSYANFDYAKQAIEFHCMEYLLKPVSADALMQTMRAAVDAVLKKRKNDENVLLAEYWNENERYRVRQFWREILEERELTDSAAIAQKARERHISLDERNKYLPVIFKLHSRGVKCQWNEAFKELLYEKVFGGKNQVVLMYNNRHMLAIAGYFSDFERHYEQISSGIRAFIRRQNASSGPGISAYMGKFKAAGEVTVQYEQLVRLASDNVAEQSGIFCLDEGRKEMSYERPDIEGWLHDFVEDSGAELMVHLNQYVDLAVKDRRINKDILTRFLQDFLQVFYIAVNEKGIQAHLLFEDDVSGEMYERAAHSATEFKAFVAHLVEKAVNYIRQVSDSDTVISRIRAYIKENLSSELNRELLAEAFFMSPDYISRIFRQKTGEKLTDYITQVRMEEARRLLRTTSMPVGEVAYASGYYNVAYFSKVFRIHNGETPAQYRSRK